ncbi:glutaredoxin family protein [Aliikangiella marina]|uniref:Glutaredoxin family protein n=1 Tax=Aliikangiella marina TaxID=1712262 RepID=A0A545TEF0_9GAMM|nr:glutaredoxin family protein [Aliikangiella marina]TQV75602.1 glutaredoxin family protein [Aliikangiella marina]
MKNTVSLYTTAGCHLCEQAEAMFLYLQQNHEQVNNNFELQEIEIANSEALVELYGVRIPVLAVGDNELGWPFELEELVDWLSANK